MRSEGGETARLTEKPVRLVVGFTPGGPSDILARALGQKLGERSNQQVVNGTGILDSKASIHPFNR